MTEERISSVFVFLLFLVLVEIEGKDSLTDSAFLFGN